MVHFSRRIQIVLVVLALVALACTCRVPSVVPTLSPRLRTPVPVSEAAADRFAQKAEQATRQGAGAGGKIDLTFTESELTSFVARELDKAIESGEQVPLTDPQIHLTGGQMWVSGQVRLSESQHVNAHVALKLDVRDGRLAITITRINLGALPVPQSLVDEFNEQLAEQLDKLNQETRNVTLTAIVIREGELQVTATFK